MEIEILAKSRSGPAPRTVNVLKDDAGLSFFCNCAAGERGRLCKHKKAIALGDENILFNEDQRDKLEEAMQWIEQSVYPGLLKELAELEEELTSVREKKNILKKRISRAMEEGLE